MFNFNLNQRRKCTYCGGDIEDSFTIPGILAAIFLFPVGMLFIMMIIMMIMMIMMGFRKISTYDPNAKVQG